MIQRVVFVIAAFILHGVSTLDVEAMQRKSKVEPQREAAWTAKWIGASAEDSTQANAWFSFRKSFALPSLPEDAQARIAVDSKYWLWVNGEQVVIEGGLKRGPTPSSTYYDAVDLVPYLQKGENVVAILVWHFGKDGFSHKDSGRAGLLFEADVGTRVISSNGSWRARRHPAYGDTGPPYPNHRLPESNVRYDARKALTGWTSQDYDATGWAKAHAYGPAPAPPWGKLVERPIPLWKDYGLRRYENDSVLPDHGDGSTVVAKLPYNAQVTPYLKVDSPPGKVIGIRTDTYVVTTGNEEGQKTVRAEYVTCEGEQAFELPGWMSGHEVHYSIPEGVQIVALRYRESGYKTSFSGKFRSDDVFLNALRQKAARTLYVGMRDTYMDTPDRERAQWWGDEVLQLGEAFYAFGLQSHDLARKGMLELAAWQREDSTLYSPIPSGNWSRELPTQMLASIGRYGFWKYYQHTGDIETIQKVYPAAKAYLELWKIGEDGLVIPRTGAWTWGDWGEHKDMTILYNGWYYLALDGMKRMARVLGRIGEAEAMKEKQKTIRDHFNKTLWTGTAYRSPGYAGQTDDRAQALAVLTGLAGREQYPGIQELFREEYHASPYMEKYVLEALYRMRRPAQALSRMKRRYGPMVQSDLTTLWERWSGIGTYNHGWSGGPLTLMSEYVAGVAPVKPGYTVYRVRPQLGPLKQVEVEVSSVEGKIEAEMRRDDTSFHLTLDSPADTEALVSIPRRAPGISFQRITLNGKRIRKGEKGATLKGVSYEGEDEHYVTFRLSPGRWKLSAR